MRTHWKKTHKKNLDWGWILFEALDKAKVRGKIPKQISGKKRYLVFYLESANPQDDNNFHLGIKGLVDQFQEGQVGNCIIDDSPKHCRVFYIPIKTNKKKRKMFVELYEQDRFVAKIDTEREFKNLIFSIEE